MRIRHSGTTYCESGQTQSPSLTPRWFSSSTLPSISPSGRSVPRACPATPDPTSSSSDSVSCSAARTLCLTLQRSACGDERRVIPWHTIAPCSNRRRSLSRLLHPRGPTRVDPVYRAAVPMASGNSRCLCKTVGISAYTNTCEPDERAVMSVCVQSPDSSAVYRAWDA